MAQLYADLTDDDSTAQAVPVPCGTRTSPGFTTFTSVTIGKVHYRDVTAQCRCNDVRLYRSGAYAYADCKAHGMRALGPMVREQGANGRLA